MPDRSTYTGSDDPLPIAQPDDPASLDPSVSVGLFDRVRAGSGVVHPDLLVPRGLLRAGGGNRIAVDVEEEEQGERD